MILTEAHISEPMGIAAVLAKISLVIGLAFMAAGAMTLFLQLDGEDRGDLMEQLKEDPAATTGTAAKAWIGYDISTPRWEKEWIGDEDHKTFMLEDIPWPDPRAALFLVPWFLLILFTGRILIKFKAPWPWIIGIIAAMATIGTLAVYILFHWIGYHMMNSGAAELGWTEQFATTRAKVSERANTSKAVGYLIGIALLNMFIFMAALWPGGGKK